MAVNPIQKLTDLYGDPASDDFGAGEEIIYGWDISQGTAVWRVPYARRFAFLQQVMGKHYVDGVTLVRQAPAQHPDAPNLWAIKVRRRVEGAVPRTFVDPDIAHRQESDWGVIPKYNTCLMEVLFSHLPFNPIWNHQDDHGKEWLRYTRWLGAAGQRTFELKPNMGQLYIVQGPGGSYTGEAPRRGAILAPLQNAIKQLGLTDLICEWYNVPDGYIHIRQPSSPNEPKFFDERRVPIMANVEGYPTDADRGYPNALLNQRSDSAIGKVNYTPFMGFEAGTLLLVNVTKTPTVEPPIYERDQENLWNKGLFFNVKFYFRYLNVPIGNHTFQDGLNLRDRTSPANLNPNNYDPNDGAYISAGGAETYHLKGWNTSYYPPTGKFYLSRVRSRTNPNASGFSVQGIVDAALGTSTTETLLHDTYEFRNFFKGVYDTLLPNREGEAVAPLT